MLISQKDPKMYADGMQILHIQGAIPAVFKCLTTQNKTTLGLALEMFVRLEINEPIANELLYTGIIDSLQVVIDEEDNQLKLMAFTILNKLAS